jgi:hypothetical protein
MSDLEIPMVRTFIMFICVLPFACRFAIVAGVPSFLKRLTMNGIISFLIAGFLLGCFQPGVPQFMSVVGGLLLLPVAGLDNYLLPQGSTLWIDSSPPPALAFIVHVALPVFSVLTIATGFAPSRDRRKADEPRS